MGDDNNAMNNSRRSFLNGLLGRKPKKEMIKMLTADGKLVQIEKSVLEAATKKQKSTNTEIFQWMKNPSKENS